MGSEIDLIFAILQENGGSVEIKELARHLAYRGAPMEPAELDDFLVMLEARGLIFFDDDRSAVSSARRP